MKFTEMLSQAAARIVAFLPHLLAALLILAVGLLIASLLDRGARRLLEKADLPRRRFMRRVVKDDAALGRVPRVTGRIVYWFVALITIGLAIEALQLQWLSAGFARVLAYLPSVLAAGVILVGAYLLANFVQSRITRREERTGEEHPESRLLSGFVRAFIYVVAGFMALQELGIATTIVTSAFIIGLSAIAIAGAVAFGWGNRELAGRITRDWYERRRGVSSHSRPELIQEPGGPPTVPQH